MDRKNDQLIFQLPQDFVFDLQRFASAEAEGRTEKATEHKKRKAREEGRVALSKDIPAAFVALLTFGVIFLLARYFFKTITDTFYFVYQNLATINIRQNDFTTEAFLQPLAKIFIPIAFITFFSAAFSNYMQIGFKFTPKAIKPDLKKISPNIFKFLKKQVFSITGGFNLVKSIIKVVIIGSLAFITIYGNFDKLLSLIYYVNVYEAFIFVVKVAFNMVMKILLVMLLFAFVDYLFVRWQYEEQLKMKKQEIKEEQKELYGDPQVKSRLRQMYQNILSQKKMLKEVPEADVVITNPTHFAIALKYIAAVDEAPRVIAKGQDRFALEIKKVALENDVFVYENPPLARSLYKEVEVNQIIPREMYSFVINAYKLSYEYKKQKTGLSS
ncbi:MAG: flagellar biosynthesis protein FlhB [Spirochaetes bacterium]|nr:flagellar biosynthesis protein FlhB [Spirochaetota bacterium]